MTQHLESGEGSRRKGVLMAASLIDPTGLAATLLDPLWERPDGRAVAAGRASGRCPVRGAPGQI